MEINTNHVPTSYDDLYRSYFMRVGGAPSLAEIILRRFYKTARPAQMEEMVHEAFIRMLRFKALEKFDPSKSNFGGMVFVAARTVAINGMDRTGRDPLGNLCGGYLENKTDDDIFEPGVYSLEKCLGSSDPSPEEGIFSRKILNSLLSWAKQLYDNPRHKRDSSLYPLIQLLAEENTPQECAAILEVTPSTIHNWRNFIAEKAEELLSTILSGSET